MLQRASFLSPAYIVPLAKPGMRLRAEKALCLCGMHLLAQCFFLWIPAPNGCIIHVRQWCLNKLKLFDTETMRIPSVLLARCDPHCHYGGRSFSRVMIHRSRSGELLPCELLRASETASSDLGEQFSGLRYKTASWAI